MVDSPLLLARSEKKRENENVLVTRPESLQLKYPQHVNSITIGRAEEILHCHCRIATEYTHELNMWRDRDYYTENVRRLQLPFTVTVKPPPGLLINTIFLYVQCLFGIVHITPTYPSPESRTPLLA